MFHMRYSCSVCFLLFFFFKQKTAYELRISDLSSDVCSSDLLETTLRQIPKAMGRRAGLNALRQGGEPIAKMARAIAPVDEGNLRESIDVSTRLARSQAGDKGALAPVEMYV